MTTCDICKQPVSRKIKPLHIAFCREGVVQDKYRVCTECYNKYALQIREDVTLDNPTPEEIALLTKRKSVKTSVTVKR
jgi:hypothetical protein